MSFLGTLLNPFGNGNNTTSANTSNTSTVYESTDQRQVTDGGSIGVTTGGGSAALNFNTNTNTYTSNYITDAGAMANAADLARTALFTGDREVAMALQTGGLATAQALDAMYASGANAADVARTALFTGDREVATALMSGGLTTAQALDAMKSTSALSMYGMNSTAGQAIAAILQAFGLTNGVTQSAMQANTGLAQSTLVANGSLSQAAMDGMGKLAVASLTNNNTNTARLLDTADSLFAGQQKALDISASLAGMLASKATGTPDTGLQTAGNKDTKVMAFAVGAVALALGLAYIVKHR